MIDALRGFGFANPLLLLGHGLLHDVELLVVDRLVHAKHFDVLGIVEVEKRFYLLSREVLDVLLLQGLVAGDLLRKID